MSLSRRRFLKWAGVINATLISATTVTGAPTKQFKGYPDSNGVLCDTSLCIGCRKCEQACNTVNELPAPVKTFDDLTVLDQKRRTTNNAFTVVNRYDNADKSDQTSYRKMQCNHCLEPACASACFVKALQKSPSGAVVYDASVCVGCRYCMIACPFEIPTYEYDEVLTPRIRKCTLCQPRITKGLRPQCVEICPTGALSFGKRDALLEVAKKRIMDKSDQYINHIYGQHEMGGTSWLYIADTSFAQIGLNEHLGDKPAIEYTSGVLSAVPLVVGLWPVLLTGVYAITKRKEIIAKKEQAEAVAITLEQASEKAAVDLKKAMDRANKAKTREIENAVKKALSEAEKAKEESDDKNEDE